MKTITNILCVVDLNEGSVAALMKAAGPKDKYNARLTILYVYDTPPQYMLHGIPPKPVQDILHGLQVFCEQYVPADKISYELETGYEGDAIVDKARYCGADLIIIPSGYKSGNCVEEVSSYVERNISYITLLIISPNLSYAEN